MLNRPGIETMTLGAPAQILANVELQASVGCLVPQDLGASQDGKLIANAGLPIKIDPANLQSPAIADGTETAAVWAFSITTAFAADESITVDGTTYTCKATENVGSKQFAGTTAAEQATSLLKMLASSDYVFSAGTSAQILAAQKEASSTETAPVVSKTSSTGAISEVTKVTAYAKAAGNAMLLHDVDVTNGAANGTALIFGFVNFNRLAEAVQEKVSCGLNAYGAVSVLKM